jgi:uncharacterized protein YecT (DUF1311 family)
MPRLGSTAALLIGALLALGLIVYVFSGSGGRRADSDPHCVSRESLDLVKSELFRRAGSVRGSTDPAFDAGARESVIRTPSRIFRRDDAASHKVTCTGAVAVDLPPGLAAVGGRRTLSGNMEFVLQRGSDGAVRLASIANADGLIGELATVSEAGAQLPPPAAKSAPASTAPQQPRPAPPPPRLAAPPQAEAPPPPQPRRQAPPAPPKPQKPATPPAKKKAEAPAPPAHAAPPKRPHIASAKPSFNCRYAKTSGEIAVCGNAELARLDREMSAEFFRALHAATPGQREILQRSRKRFLGYRDSCGSEACIADAYRGRMREIADIMNGNW